MSSAFVSLDTISISVQIQLFDLQPVLGQEGKDVILSAFEMNVGDEDISFVTYSLVVQGVLVLLEDVLLWPWCFSLLCRLSSGPLVSTKASSLRNLGWNWLLLLIAIAEVEFGIGFSATGGRCWVVGRLVFRWG
jgi:hypothetical protein